MFLWIFDQLTKVETAFNALTYLSSRGILALITAILLSMALYPPWIRRLRAMKLGQPIRELGPETHFSKKGTPTMGGLVIILSTLASAWLWSDMGNKHLWVLTFVTVGYGFIGFLDDYLKISKKNSAGLSSRKKMLGVIAFGAAAVAYHVYTGNAWNAHAVDAQMTNTVTQLRFPFFKDLLLDLGVLMIPFGVIVLIGASNAVNLTDGLDGLVIGPVITCSMALLVLAYVTGNAKVADYLLYHRVLGSGEICIFLSALIGSSIGFLWYNTWPAQVFMGDSGSLPLGGILGMVAIITGHEILLIVMGGVFVVEALSVILQVGSYKLTRKRIFKMAPLHHHFEKAGWPEQKITVRTWIISFMLALVSILTLKFR